MIDSLRHFLIGPPLPTRQLAGERLNKVRALAAFSPGALSSIAYANQEIYLALVLAGSLGLSQALPISLTITALMAIVALSYYQTIYGYPSGGGSYVVARENLGMLPGLLAASALLVDYLLTAAVSLTAGVEAIASAFPALWGVSHRAVAAPSGRDHADQPARDKGNRHTDVGTGVPVPLRLPGDAGLRRVPGADRGRDPARDHGAAGRRAFDRVPAAARLRHRLHRDDRHRGDQQRRAGVQAARSRRTPAAPCW